MRETSAYGEVRGKLGCSFESGSLEKVMGA